MIIIINIIIIVVVIRYPGQSLSSFIPQASRPALDVVTALLKLKPEDRPTAAQALQMDFFADAQVPYYSTNYRAYCNLGIHNFNIIYRCYVTTRHLLVCPRQSTKVYSILSGIITALMS